MQAIYFADIKELFAGVQAMAADQDVRLMRVNNKLRPDYRSEVTAGYRDFAVNLCIETSDTRRLCLETHVCEVQLILIDFAKIKV